MAVTKRKKLHPALRRRVYERDGWKCQYCGLQFDPKRTWNPDSIAPYLGTGFSDYVFLELDHIHPLHHGGQDTEDNLCAACTPCNRKKSFKVLGARA